MGEGEFSGYIFKTKAINVSKDFYQLLRTSRDSASLYSDLITTLNVLFWKT